MGAEALPGSERRRRYLRDHMAWLRELRRPATQAPVVLTLLCIACSPNPPPVRDAEAEALRNTRAAGVSVYAPVTMASPDELARCRRSTDGTFVFERGIEVDEIARHLQDELARTRETWARDAEPIRVEVDCDAARLVLTVSFSWYSANLGQVLHGEDPMGGVAVKRGVGRRPVSPHQIAVALDGRAGEHARTIVVMGDELRP